MNARESLAAAWARLCQVGLQGRALAAVHFPTAAHFEQLALEYLGGAVGYDVAFLGLRGASITSVGFAPDLVDRAVRPGSEYEVELAPVRRAALAARGVAVDTEVLGECRVKRTAYFRDLALFVGCGGAVGPRQFAVCYPGIEIDVVESEDHVIELARSFYGLDSIPGLTVHHAEDASFLAAAAGSWDIIVVDAYEGDELGNGFSGPAFFRGLRERLRPGGAFAFNVVGTLDGSGGVRSVVRAAASVFDDVRLVPVMTTVERYDPSTVRNVVVVGVR